MLIVLFASIFNFYCLCLDLFTCCLFVVFRCCDLGVWVFDFAGIAGL